MFGISRAGGLKLTIVSLFVAILSSCSSTEMAGGSIGETQEFAFSVSSRHDLLQRQMNPDRAITSPKRQPAKKQKPVSKSAAKAKIAAAKKQYDRDAKRLADFDKMVARLPESQHKYFTKQRKTIADKVSKSRAAYNKVNFAAAPRSAGARGARYHSLIAKYAAANGVPLKLAHAVVRVESSYRANARGGAGEIGLMQIKLATARGMGYRGSAKQLYDPATNIRWGMKYLGKAHKLAGGSTCGTILKYNAGHGAKRMNPVSRRYCNRVARYI